jgi:hypothetical protein
VVVIALAGYVGVETWRSSHTQTRVARVSHSFRRSLDSRQRVSDDKRRAVRSASSFVTSMERKGVWSILGIPGAAALFGRDIELYDRAFVVKGNTSFSKEVIRDWASSVGPDIDGRPERVRQAIRDMYLRHGYLKAQVTVGAAAKDVVDVSITEGPVYRWGQIEIFATTVDPEEVLNQLPVEAGHPVDLMAFRDSHRALLESQRDRGYLDFNSNVDLQYDDAHGLFSIALDLAEGPLYIVARIEGGRNARTQALQPLLGGPFIPSVVEYLLSRAGLSKEGMTVDKNRPFGEVTLRFE